VLAAAGYGAWHTYETRFKPPAQQAGQGPGPGGGGRGPGGPQLVEVAPVATGRVVDVTEAVGTTRALESIVVTSKISGIVQSIGFEEGQFINKGDELIRLDGAERRADVEAAFAQIVQTEAQRDEIRQRLDRARKLTGSGAVTEARIDELEAQLRSAEALVKSREALRRAVEARFNDLVILAPFDGRVGVRQISVGAYIEPKTAITTLDDLSSVRLDFAVPENLLGALTAGSEVTAFAAAYGERAFTGKVAVVDTRIDPVTRSVRLTALIPNANRELRPGMFMNVRLSVNVRENAVLVPEEALVGEGPRHIAYAVVDGKVQRRVVTIGQRQPDRVEILAGLKAGETIIVRGVQRVRPGQEVRTRPADGAPTPAPPGGAPMKPQAAAPGARPSVAR
jgi:membrane fusion protein (multidrug efflux system)